MCINIYIYEKVQNEVKELLLYMRRHIYSSRTCRMGRNPGYRKEYNMYTYIQAYRIEQEGS